MTNQPNQKLKEFLDRLSIESWQLELLVSGVAVFMAGSSLEPLLKYGRRLNVISEGIDSHSGLLSIFASVLIVSIFFIFVNLILHIVFRGMWISALGLRSISGDINFEELRFVKPFDRFMKKRIKSFDQFIQRLEDISSVIFAFTFLIVFMLISLALFFFFIILIGFILNTLEDWWPGEYYEMIGIPVFVLVLIIGLLYFLDFVTLGFFKRKRWISVWYYPLYRFMSVITFSWLYRPLYYNLIDHKFGRRVGLFLVPYFILVGVLASVRATMNLYIPDDKDGLELIDRYFEDTREEGKPVSDISIPSKYISNSYLELFIEYSARNDDYAIKDVCPDVQTGEESGLSSNIVMFNGGKDDKEISADSLLNCIQSIYEIYIEDSLYQELDFYYFEHPEHGQEGIKTIIDLQHLERGKYDLEVKKLEYVKKDSFSMDKLVRTPIWLE